MGIEEVTSLYELCDNRIPKKKKHKSKGLKPTKDQFVTYLEIQKSGCVNMLAKDLVCKLSFYTLCSEHLNYIYEHYAELCDEYQVDLTKVDSWE